jgi:hypothetical protein
LIPQDEIINTERDVLRVLCQGHLPGPAVARVRTSLAGYQWHEPLHQIIFGALLSIPFSDPNIIRDLLPARLVMRGFPDVKFEELFEPVAISAERAEQLVERLRQTG